MGNMTVNVACALFMEGLGPRTKGTKVYDTITIAPVETGSWLILLAAIIAIVLAIAVGAARKMKQLKPIGYGIGCAFMIVLFGGTIISIHTSSIVDAHVDAALTSQLGLEQVDRKQDESFIALRNGEYISGRLASYGTDRWVVIYDQSPPK